MDQECPLPDPDKEECEDSKSQAGCSGTPTVGNPIFVGSGTKIETETDYSDSKGLSFTRTYRSNRVAAGPTGFAGGTFSNFHLQLVTNSTFTRLYAYRASGAVLRFSVVNGVVQGEADVEDRITKILDANGNADGWRYYRAPSEDIETYDRDGRLMSILHRNGQVVRLTYRGFTGDPYPIGAPVCKTTPPDFVINGTFSPWCVTDAYGRQLNFDYDVQGRMARMIDPSGQATIYEYNGPSALYPNNNGPTLALLTKVTYPNQTSRTYFYDEASNSASMTRGLLTGVADENGTRYATFRYDANGKAIDTQHGGGVNRYQIANAGNGNVVVTDPLGAARSYNFTALLGVQRNTTITQPLSGGGTVSRTLSYDTVGNIVGKVDFGGEQSCYEYDTTRNLETKRIEGVVAGQTCSVTASVLPAGARKVETVWDSTFRVPAQRTTKNSNGALEARTTWAYNSRGQATARCEIDPADAPAMSYACSATTAPPAGAKVRRTVTTYCEQADVTAGTCPLVGLTRSVNGPRPASDTGMTAGQDDLATYTYYQTDDATCASNGTCPHRKGDLWKVTNALGQVTTYVTYDKNGRVTRTQDANGTYTDFVYHVRGWLTDRIVRASATGAPGAGDATTHIDYDAVGNVKKVTQPDGAFLAYIYDDAHRLTKIADNLNNAIDYCPGGVGSAQCLDAAGNRRVEQVKDPSGTIKRALSRSYNQLSQLVRLNNAAGTAVEQSQGLSDTGVTDGYDGNGNRVLAQDGLGFTTKQRYDGLNRLVETIQNLNGTDTATANTSTGFAYDTRDNLRQVTDPDSLNTVYDYDGLNNLTGLHSPDTGNSAYTYDLAGNRKTQTDARGVTSTYTYDALNRLSGIAYPTSSLNVGYAYDQANATTGCATSYPVGRLTTMTDASGTTTYCYDRRGNVTRKQVTTGPAFTTGYSYTTADRLASITYPSGAIVTYARDVLGRVTGVTWKANATATATTIVSNASYYPFGPLNVLTFGNGRTLTKAYDQDYAIDSVVSSASTGLALDFGVDVMGNIVGAVQPGSATQNPASYAYDPLYRLKDVQVSSTTGTVEAYTYNKTGDRLSSKRLSDPVVNYAYAAGSHRLASVGGVARTYDANGNTQTGVAASLNLTYDARNRLGGATKGTMAATYTYNGRGERAFKQTKYSGLGEPPILYLYDESGQLLSEYTGTGFVGAEYVYLDGTPIAVVQGGSLAYVEADHLGTPRQVFDPATNAARWAWNFFGNTFGADAPEQSPSGGVAYTLNLRLPGQYFDSETNLSQNYFRDYEAAIGRYVESDPIGLNAGPNTYSYVRSNSLKRTDRLGLLEVDPSCAYCDKDGDVEWRQQFNAKIACIELIKQIKNGVISECIIKRCQSNAKIYCNGNQCRPGIGGYNDYESIGSSMFAARGLIIPKPDIHICVPYTSWNRRASNILHELAHSCGWDHGDGGGVPHDPGP